MLKRINITFLLSVILYISCFYCFWQFIIHDEFQFHFRTISYFIDGMELERIDCYGVPKAINTYNITQYKDLEPEEAKFGDIWPEIGWEPFSIFLIFR